VPWAIVCDGLVYQFGTGKPQIFEQVLGAGVADGGLRQAVDQAAAGAPAGFQELRELGASSGIFTLATGWEPADESFEAYLNTIASGRLAEAARIVGRSKPRQGRHVASESACPEDVDALYGMLLRRLGMTKDESETPWPTS
jgi:hypothetical protein